MRTGIGRSGGRFRGRALVVLVALVVITAACSSDSGSSTSGTGAPATVPTTAAPSATASPPSRYYVSLGDSYASGYEPAAGNTTDGFAYQVADQLDAKGFPVDLVNFGCAGATTESLLRTDGCPPVALGPDADPYAVSQIEAAEQFLQDHQGQVDLITVSIGGNDVTKCGQEGDPVACVTQAAQTLGTNVPEIARRLRAAAGPDALIVGTTYPDVILGEWVGSAPNGKQLAALSIPAFKDIINPTLEKAYATVAGQFADVTAATGAYGPMTETTDFVPYGAIPTPVARVCELTHYCEQQDIHPNRAGYQAIADLVVQLFVAAQTPG
jgi:lysophospholipase L1-like esterase